MQTRKDLDQARSVYEAAMAVLEEKSALLEDAVSRHEQAKQVLSAAEEALRAVQPSGWQTQDGQVRHYTIPGYMDTGITVIDGRTYHFSEKDGALTRSDVTAGGKSYKADPLTGQLTEETTPGPQETVAAADKQDVSGLLHTAPASKAPGTAAEKGAAPAKTVTDTDLTRKPSGDSAGPLAGALFAIASVFMAAGISVSRKKNN